MFRIRTVTAFTSLTPKDFEHASKEEEDDIPRLQNKIEKCSKLLREMEKELVREGYEVQTLRLVTNPFGEWLYHSTSSPSSTKSVNVELAMQRLQLLDKILEKFDINFCSLGPATSIKETALLCPKIVSVSFRFSCSANVAAADTKQAKAAADCILTISQLGEESNFSPASPAPQHLAGGLGNFRFCAAASCEAFIPFFPAATSKSGCELGFALGLENGGLAQFLLSKTKTIDKIGMIFKEGMRKALLPLETISRRVSSNLGDGSEYLGIDSSLNPSLDEGGSVAEAIELIHEVKGGCEGSGGGFGGRGTLAVAAEITKALQSLQGIKLTGYCGLMLPVCEDNRLSELASESPPRLEIVQILNISSVCGVGVDTVPIPGDCTSQELTSLILDVAGLAHRWKKSLSCRVFPYPGKCIGEQTQFNSPYMCNCRIFSP